MSNDSQNFILKLCIGISVICILVGLLVGNYHLVGFGIGNGILNSLLLLLVTYAPKG